MKKQLAKNKKIKRSKQSKPHSNGNVNKGIDAEPTFEHKDNFEKNCNLFTKESDDIMDSSK